MYQAIDERSMNIITQVQKKGAGKHSGMLFNKKVTKAEIEEQKEVYFDNQQYCICRRGDDGLVFMIECDSCKEWFHGDCVGISK